MLYNIYDVDGPMLEQQIFSGIVPEDNEELNETKDFPSYSAAKKYCEREHGCVHWIGDRGYNRRRELIIRIEPVKVETFQRCINALNLQFQHLEFQINHQGEIQFVHEDMEITDPYLSSCGRFLIDPFETYGLPDHIAALIKFHNGLISGK